MVGGKQQIFDRNLDLMKVMGGNVVLTGDIGAGGVTKLANQIIVAANIEALSEALVLSQKAGVDPEKVFNAIRGGRFVPFPIQQSKHTSYHQLLEPF